MRRLTSIVYEVNVKLTIEDSKVHRCYLLWNPNYDLEDATHGVLESYDKVEELETLADVAKGIVTDYKRKMDLFNITAEQVKPSLEVVSYGNSDSAELTMRILFIDGHVNQNWAHHPIDASETRELFLALYALQKE